MSYPRILLNVSHIMIDGLFDSVPLLLAFIAISFNATEKDTGFLFSLALLVTTSLGLSSKFFSLRFNFFTLISLILFFNGAGFILASFSGSLQAAGLSFVAALAGYCAFHNLAFSHLASNIPRLQLGHCLGDFTALGDLGRIPFASLAAFAAALPAFGFAGWRIVCLVYGLGALSLAAYLFRLPLRQKTSPLPSPIAAQRRLFPDFSMLKNNRYAPPLAASVLDAIASDHLFTFLPYLLFAKGIDPKIIAGFALAFTCGCFLGKAACGRLVDHCGARKVFIASELVMLCLLLLLIASDQTGIVVVISLLLGVVTKGTVPVIQAILGETAHEKAAYDDIFPLNTFLRGSISMLLPFCFGLIAANFQVSYIYAIMSVAACAAVIPLLACTKSDPARSSQTS